MTNLTSEQYREVLKHIPDVTTEIPNVQHLLRRAVQTFFKRFRAYPELAGVAPGKVGIFGDQTQFSDGLALPAATPMATIVVGRRAPGSRYTVVTSADVGKPHKVTFSFSRKRPLAPGCPSWLNYVKGVIDNYPERVPPFEAAIESSVPMGVGFGSTAALEVATYSFLEVLVGKRVDPIEKAKALQKAEAEFAGKEVGLVDRITSILARDRNAMMIDCKTNDVMWIPFRHSKVTLLAVNSHLKDELYGDEYPEKIKLLKKACELLGVENLRSCTEENLNDLENRVNEILEMQEEEKEEQEQEGEGEEEEETKKSSGEEVWTREDYNKMIKTARFFITEMDRINEAIEAWNEGNIESFGEKMKESHKSLKEDFDMNNPVLDFLVESSFEVEGVLGSRMTGMGLGFGGGIVTLINKNNIEQYCRHITGKFTEYSTELTENMKEVKREAMKKQFEVRKRIHSEHFNPAIASSEKIGRVQDLLAAGALLQKTLKRTSVEGNPCLEKKRSPCIVKVEKLPEGCGTWGRFEKNRQKSEFLRKLSLEVEEGLKEEEMKKKEAGKETKKKEEAGREAKMKEEAGREAKMKEEAGREAKMKEEAGREAKMKEEAGKEEDGGGEEEGTLSVSDVELKKPSFYILSPFAGARMMFVTKADMLRSRYANPIPHPKALARAALKEFDAAYGGKVEAIGLAPAAVYLFGEFMEFHLGYLIAMTVPLYVVTVGGRSDNVFFSVKTTSNAVGQPTDMRYPVPSVRAVEVESRSWVNVVTGLVNEFKGHVPGFNAVIHSNVPIRAGFHSCASLQASIYTFLENLTRECTTDPFEKIDRCNKSEYEYEPTPTELVSRCSSTKFIPVLLCKEGHLMIINCRSYKISHYFFDDPAYVFLIAHCKQNTTDINLEALEERLRQCKEALDIVDRQSLLYLDVKHLRCLKKRDATEEVIKRAKYVITEHQRTVEAIKAIKEEDYARVGLLMSQSHASLRDDYEVSSPQIEALIKVALAAKGVLGAKMIGGGLTATIAILIKLEDADTCIRYMRKNYVDKSDKPEFYITKPSGSAFGIDPDVQMPYIL